MATAARPSNAKVLASVRPARQAQGNNDTPFCIVYGTLVGFDAREFQRKNGSGSFVKHELTLRLRGSNRQMKLIQMHDHFIDLTALLDDDDHAAPEVSFGVVYFKPDQYGRSLYKDGPALVGYGRLPQDVVTQFEVKPQ